MMKKNMKLIDIILPSKKINFFVVSVLILGVVSGSLFLISLNSSDRAKIILKIQSFFIKVNDGTIDNGQALKNSLIINYIFVFVLWILGLTIIGVLFNIFLTYIKGFIVGFSISSMILTYKYKGVLAGGLYVISNQIFNVIVVLILTIYSIMFSYNLFLLVFGKKSNKLMIKRYVVILIFCIILSLISSLLEIYLFPRLLKVIISLYVG